MTEAAGTAEPAASGTAEPVASGTAEPVASGTADDAQGSETLPDAPADAPAGAVGIAYALASAIVVLDQATKTLVLDVLTPGRFVPWLGGGVGWQLVLNPGGAFGLPAPHWLFLAVTVVVVVVVARSLPRVPTLLHAAAYGLLLAGALGNAIDRLVRAGGPGFGRGYVVDFVAWGGFPRFNVADSAITIGFLLLVVALWLDERAAGSAQRVDGADVEVGAGAAGDEGAGGVAVTGS